MFKSVEELVELSISKDKRIYDIMIEFEMDTQEISREEVFSQMEYRYKVMKSAIKKGIKGVKAYSGLTGGDAKKIQDYIKRGDYLTNKSILKSISYAIATNEVNASMGVICATPTAGSSGVLPGVMFAMKKKLSLSKKDMINSFFTAGAFGYIVANNAFISGAAGGCQAEIGSASAMAAAALTHIRGADARVSANAFALALKNMLGLACDPVAGLVEVPCIKRNAAGALNSILASEMALAGIESKIPWDEVIWAMKKIGQSMPVGLRETSISGLAATNTGKKWKEILNKK